MEKDKRTRNPKLDLLKCFNLITDYSVYKDSCETLIKKYDISKTTFYEILKYKGAYEFLNDFKLYIDRVVQELNDTLSGLKQAPILNYGGGLIEVFVGNTQYYKYTPEYFNAIEEKTNLYNQIKEYEKNNDTQCYKYLELIKEYRNNYKLEELLNFPQHPISGGSCSLKEMLRVDPKLASKVTLLRKTPMYDVDRLNELKNINKINFRKNNPSIDQKMDQLLATVNDLIIKINDKEKEKEV